MATSTLKAVILIAVIVVGVITIRNGFPENVSDDVAPAATATPAQNVQSPSPTTTFSPSPTEARQPRKGRTTVQVLNGTDIDFFAATWTDVLKADGWGVATPTNAPTTQNTTILHRPAFLVEAEAIQAAFFPEAVVEEAPGSMPDGVQVQVVLGSNAPSPTPTG